MGWIADLTLKTFKEVFHLKTNKQTKNCKKVFILKDSILNYITVYCLKRAQTWRLVSWKQTIVKENSFKEMMEESSDLLSSLASEKQTFIPVFYCSTF